MKKSLLQVLGHKFILIAALLLVPSAAYAWPWSDDMANQISIKPQESIDPANPGMKPFPKRSVPVAGTTVMVADQSAAREMVNPVAPNSKSVATGARLFSIYCTPCHGASGTGDGLVGAKLLMKPWNLTLSNDMHSWSPDEYPDGYIWGYITFGGAVMPGYANDLSVTERWHVVNYLREILQNGQATAQAK